MCLHAGCRALIREGSYCPRHTRPKKRNPRRGSGWQAQKWRDRVLRQTGGRCAVPGCRTPDDRVQAHHLVALADGGDPEGEGVALCHRHHVQASERERRGRARAPAPDPPRS
jgi:hypothetical protein